MPRVAALHKQLTDLESCLADVKHQNPTERALTSRQQYAIARSIHAIDWMVTAKPTWVITCVMAASVRCLNALEEWWAKLLHGQQSLSANYRGPIGITTGFSWRAEQDAFMTTFCEWTLVWVAQRTGANSDTVQGIKSAFRSNLKLHSPNPQTYPGRFKFKAPCGTRYPPFWRRWLYHHLKILAGMILGLLGRSMLWAWLPMLVAIGQHFTLVQRTAFFLLIGLGSLKLVSLSRGLASGCGWYRLLDTGRRPVLFLRSFDDDALDVPQGPMRLLLDGRFPFSHLKDPNSEERLVRALQFIGPVIAIEAPNARRLAPGAARITVRGSDWQSMVRSLAKQAALVVLLPGYTMGIRWEMQEVRSLTSPIRTLLYAPPSKRHQLVRYEGDEETLLYEQFFREVVYGAMKVDAPRVQNAEYLWFSPSWKARWLRAPDSLAGWNPIHWDGVTASLQPVFSSLGVEQPDRRRVLVKSLLYHTAIAISGIAILWLSGAMSPR